MPTPARRGLEALEELVTTMKQMSDEEVLAYYRGNKEHIDAFASKAHGVYDLLSKARNLQWADHMAEVRGWADRGWPTDYEFRTLGRVTPGDNM